MANVYLMWSARNMNDTAPESVGHHFYDEYKAAKPESRPAAPGAICLSILMDYDRALKSTLDWSFARHKSDDMRMIHTDEEDGRFKVVGLRPGIWHVIARGRTGINEAIWE